MNVTCHLISIFLHKIIKQTVVGSVKPICVQISLKSDQFLNFRLETKSNRWNHLQKNPPTPETCTGGDFTGYPSDVPCKLRVDDLANSFREPWLKNNKQIANSKIWEVKLLTKKTKKCFQLHSKMALDILLNESQSDLSPHHFFWDLLVSLTVTR